MGEVLPITPIIIDPDTPDEERVLLERFTSASQQNPQIVVDAIHALGRVLVKDEDDKEYHIEAERGRVGFDGEQALTAFNLVVDIVSKRAVGYLDFSESTWNKIKTNKFYAEHSSVRDSLKERALNRGKNPDPNEDRYRGEHMQLIQLEIAVGEIAVSSEQQDEEDSTGFDLAGTA